LCYLTRQNYFILTTLQESKRYSTQFQIIEEIFVQQQLALDGISIQALREARRSLTSRIQQSFKVIDDIKANEMKSVYVGVKTLDSLPRTPEKLLLAQTRLLSPEKAQSGKDTRGLKLLL